MCNQQNESNLTKWDTPAYPQHGYSPETTAHILQCPNNDSPSYFGIRPSKSSGNSSLCLTQKLEMVLCMHSNTSYLSTPKGHSWATGYCFLSTCPQAPPTALEPPPDNGPVHVLCQIMKQVVSSAAEAKLGALFLNAQAVCPIKTALDELGHLQPATPLQIDNSMASGIANDTVLWHKPS